MATTLFVWSVSAALLFMIGACNAANMSSPSPFPSHMPSKTVEVAWTLFPSPSSYNLTCGDTMVFNWEGKHDVWLMQAGDCNFTGQPELSDHSGFNITFTEAGTFFYACEVEDHCSASNMKIEVAVVC